MKAVKIGLLREGKVPPDKRVAFTPRQVQEILQRFPHVSVFCQPSSVRGFSDDEYADVGAVIKEDLSECDILMGVKEVPVTSLIPDKIYLFFSHTIKKQPYNRKLLQEILRKNIRLIDYETLKDWQGNRLVAFGRYAGIVGAYNALWTVGKRYQIFDLRRAYDCFDVNDLKLELRKAMLPPIKIALTGAGRVARGAMETLDGAGVRKVSPQAFLRETFNVPVYVQLNSSNYHVREDGGAFNREEFHTEPEHYTSVFRKFAAVSDVLIAGAYWNPKAPMLFTRDDMTSPDFRIRIIADITCDINGSIPSTKKASTIDDPLYDYDPVKDEVLPALSGENHITVMAIDNLPCELPRSSSEEFGRDLIDFVVRPLVIDDSEGIIERATITKEGKLTHRFAYLQDYADGKTS